MRQQPPSFSNRQWEHDVFPAMQKSLIFWFLFQVCVVVFISLISGRLIELVNYRAIFLLMLIALSGYMAIPFFRQRLGKTYVPVFIFLLSLTPTLSTTVDFWFSPSEPPTPYLIGEFYRELPFIMAAVIFTAWFYSLRGIIIYALIMTALNIALYQLRQQFFELPAETWHLVGMRFGTIIFIGYILALMVNYARNQGDSLAKSNAQLINYSETLEQLAANREREAMARELHDTLSHSLTALTIQLEVTKALIDQDSDQAKQSLQTALDTARDGLKETRCALQHLRSGQVEQQGLVAGLHKLQTDIRPDLTLQLTLPSEQQIEALPAKLQNTLYRIAQEAMRNAEKHSQAHHLAITLICDNDQVQLTIVDDGRGFAVENHEKNGFGLRGMKERAMLANGSLTIHSTPAEGTEVNAQFAL